MAFFMTMRQDFMIYGEHMKIIFGIDIGGTQMKFGVFSEACNLMEKWAVDTDISDLGKHIIPSIEKEIREYTVKKGLEMEEILGIGLGIPGPVDENGYVRTCVNLNWHEFNPVEELQRIFPGTKIAAGNDANVAAMGEYYKGAGKEYSSMMLITLGTGVGGGIILDGKILQGASGIAGEIGHITPGYPEAEHCNCGNVGCVDQFASASGIVRIMKRLLRERTEDSKLRGKEEFTAKDVCRMAEEGDALARECIDICMGVLGKGLAFFSHAFDPQVYVIGGGVSKAGKLITDAIERHYTENLFLIRKGAEIRLAKLGNDAGIIGACMLAAQQMN